VRIVALEMEKAAERVLHRSRHLGETWVFNVGRWMMFAPIRLFGIMSPRVDLVQDEHLPLRLVANPVGLALLVVEPDGADAVLVEERLQLVVLHPDVRIHDDRGVLRGEDLLLLEAPREERLDHALELPRTAWSTPGSRRARRC
jgi:hypothetical protein